MIILGIVLLLIALLLPALNFLFWVGVLLVLVGLVLAISGYAGRPVGGRSHWY